MKRKIALLFFLVLFTFTNLLFVQAENPEREATKNSLIKQFDLEDKFFAPKLGTVPLPATKEMAYPYPAGFARLQAAFPDNVDEGEEFSISVTYTTSNMPFSALMLFHQMSIPPNTELPTHWRQQNISPWAPQDNTDTSGPIASLPSIQWVEQNWDNWYGIGIAPFETESLLMHSSQGWSHGHYFFAFDGDRVTITYGPFSFDEEGIYKFIIAPKGYYLESHLITTQLEPVSFIIKAGDDDDEEKEEEDEDDEDENENDEDADDSDDDDDEEEEDD